MLYYQSDHDSLDQVVVLYNHRFYNHPKIFEACNLNTQFVSHGYAMSAINII